MIRFKHVIFITTVMSLAACTVEATVEATATPLAPTLMVEAPSVAEQEQGSMTNTNLDFPVYGYTFNSPDGNRYVEGQGQITQSDPVDITLDGEPSWLVGVGHPEGGSVWATILIDGRARVFGLDEVGNVSTLFSQEDSATLASPLTLEIGADGGFTVHIPSNNEALGSGIICLENSRFVYITENGDLIVREQGESGELYTLAVNAMLDSRIVQNGEGLIAVLTNPTTDYAHGVLGNTVEASAITIIDTTGDTPEIYNVIDRLGMSVIEGTSPMWADINLDGEDEIIVTLANAQEGARIVAFSPEGSIIAESDPIGQGNRWRHQLAVAPFDGEPQLVDVLTPHLGRTVEFFTFDDGKLVVTESLSGYTSHQIGSPNLDTAVAGDFNGDGIIELLLPNAGFNQLAGIVINQGNASVAYELETGAVITSNLSTAMTVNGLAVGVGLKNNTLRIWQ